MQGVNKVILIGNLGRDPEVRTLENGVKVTTFSMATTESYKDRDGNKQQITDWHNIVLWRGLAEIAERYLRKGSPIYIEGKIKTRSYEQDGVTKYTTEIVGDNMTMLGGRQDGNGGYSAPPAPSEANDPLTSSQGASAGGESAGGGAELDDLPF